MVQKLGSLKLEALGCLDKDKAEASALSSCGSTRNAVSSIGDALQSKEGKARDEEANEDRKKESERTMISVRSKDALFEYTLILIIFLLPRQCFYYRFAL